MMSQISRTSFILLAALFALATASQAEQPTQHQNESSAEAEPASPEAIKQETAELLKTLKSYGADQREEAVAATKSALETVDQRIDTLQTRIDNNWDSMSQTARERMRASMDALRERRTEVAEWFGSLQSSSDSAWDQIKDGFSDAYQALADSWDDAVEAFQSE